MDVKVKLKGGEMRSTNDLKAAIEKAVLKMVMDGIPKKAAVRCREHSGQTVKVSGSGSSLDRLQWSVEACCEKAVEEATKALR